MKVMSKRTSKLLITILSIFFINSGKHFQIEFNISKNLYTIRDLGLGFGAFLRLEYPLLLKNNHLINLGETFIVVNIIDKSLSENENLYLNPNFETLGELEKKRFHIRLKLFGSNNNGETLYITIIII